MRNSEGGMRKAEWRCEALEAGLYFEVLYFSGEGIAVDAEGIRRLAEVAGAAVDHLRHEALLEFSLRVLVMDPARHHLVDELVEEPMHARRPQPGEAPSRAPCRSGDGRRRGIWPACSAPHRLGGTAPAAACST